MDATYKTMLSLLRCALWGQEEFLLLPEEEMAAVWEELQRQHVQALCADVLGRQGDRNAVQAAAVGIRRWFQVLTVQSELLKLLEQEKIPVAVLKGGAVDRYYPRPEYRAMGDIDLLVRPEDFDTAAKALTAAGCELYNSKDRHYGYHYKTVSLELHHHFTLSGGAALDDRLYAALGKLETATMQGFTFPVLPTVENGLVLLEHIKQHLHTGMGLRQMLDWMFYVHACLRNEETFRDTFAPEARKFGLEKLAVTATRLCQDYLGLPTVTWCGEGDAVLCEKLLTQMLEGGNFGEKDLNSSKAVDMLNLARHPIRFLREMQTIGCRTWKALEKYPFLKCFAWLYQICRLVRRGFARKQALSQLRSDMGKADRLQELLDELGIA